MKSETVALIAAASVAIAHTPALAARAACDVSDERLLQEIRAVHEKQRNVGVQTAISRNGRIVFSRGVGYADFERRIPVTRQTVFPVASVTKGFTGVATLKAVASGKLALDAPIQTYVPEFPVKPELAITPRRLAAHRAGIRHWGDEREPLYGRHFDRLSDILPLFKDDPLQAKAGLEYQYTSYGYNLLGLAVERATGTDFTQLVERQILRPLGLGNTRFDDPRRPPRGAAKLYSFYDLKSYADLTEPVVVPPRDYSHNMAGGNMSSSAEDLVRFGDALLKPGLVPEPHYAMLFEQPTFGGEASPMTFGFFASEAGKERRLNISGSNAGLQAALFIYPERKLVVSLLSNTWGVGSRSGEMVSDLPKRIADLCAPAPVAR